ncbi:helix-turn-helix domain-containing protein [Wansuia hejianensis]|uniref:Helix-turn-helix transcriptional regulator n=1 Tax=Wansuia hejianensis TaxID=2763667 RepID=A0A926IHX6_9FIRM|nr:helix-turn-helix transcriptional regulator [Wansuia hejianensis]MBC8591147.1 helix-turn-helix transcriptional regulator [Wansuia hejianensis]
MDLGMNIKRLRETKGYSQEMVAEKLGVSRQSVSKWENNISEPSTENLLKLSVLFNVEVDYLINGEEYNLEINLQEIKTTERYYYNEIRAKTISYIILLFYFPLNVYFYNSGIYGEVFIDLSFLGKMFFRDLLYDIPFIIIMAGMLLRFIKDRKDPSKKSVLITRKDKIINYLSFSILSLILLLVYFKAPEFSSIALFIAMFGLVYIALFETIRELTKKEFEIER